MTFTYLLNKGTLVYGLVILVIYETVAYLLVNLLVIILFICLWIPAWLNICKENLTQQYKTIINN